MANGDPRNSLYIPRAFSWTNLGKASITVGMLPYALTAPALGTALGIAAAPLYGSYLLTKEVIRILRENKEKTKLSEDLIQKLNSYNDEIYNYKICQEQALSAIILAEEKYTNTEQFIRTKKNPTTITEQVKSIINLRKKAIKEINLVKEI
jgi:hypothetical protein